MAGRLIEIGNIDIEAIKDLHPLESVVCKYVKLKRRGEKLEGLCPFHMERTESFKIFEKDQHFHCFGCGAHGDIFDFLQMQEGLDLRAAAEHLTGGAWTTYSSEQLEELRARRAAFEQEEQLRKDAAILAARARWIAAQPDVGPHPYLTAKGVQAHGIRRDGDMLLVPVRGPDGKIQSLQSIAPDGRKLFEEDAPVTGGLHMIGGQISTATSTVLVCEGYSTAATLHEATGQTVVCTFNAGNMASVAAWLAETYPASRYMIAGDDDRGGNKNPGRTAALDAGRILQSPALFPVFPEGSDGTDFNDMARDYGIDAVRALVVDGELPNGDPAPEPEEPEKSESGEGESTFQLLDLDELENMPPPTWLVHEMVADEGLTIIYGDPGAGKSFIALDMALRIAHAMDWHGTAAKPTGVLYIAGEGARGFGKRVKGWRREHAMEGVEAPFMLLPVAVQILDKNDRAKLLRTINEAVRRAGFAIGLIVIDTVSRALAGADENGQEAMSAFVGACDEIKAHSGGAVIGVHHSGKDRERGMRGSTVLLGGCDASLQLSKADDIVTLKTEKQKDAEEAEPIHMRMKKVEWVMGLEEPQSTLVPFLSEAPTADNRNLSRSQIDEIFNVIDAAWTSGNPLSPFPHAKRTGRYAPDIIARRYEISIALADSYLKSWQENGMIITTELPRKQGKGLCVVERFTHD